jgi:hypothetical protein
MYYQSKYLKYKEKYLNLKNKYLLKQNGGKSISEPSVFCKIPIINRFFDCVQKDTIIESLSKSWLPTIEQLFIQKQQLLNVKNSLTYFDTHLQIIKHQIAEDIKKQIDTRKETEYVKFKSQSDEIISCFVFYYIHEMVKNNKIQVSLELKYIQNFLSFLKDIIKCSNENYFKTNIDSL